MRHDIWMYFTGLFWIFQLLYMEQFSACTSVNWKRFLGRLLPSVACTSVNVFDVVILKNPWAVELSIVVFMKSIINWDRLLTFQEESNGIMQKEKMKKYLPYWVRNNIESQIMQWIHRQTGQAQTDAQC